MVVLVMLSVAGCGPVGEKTTSMSVIYGFVAIIAVLMLCIYCAGIKKKNLWMLMLFSSIIVVDMGYLVLAISEKLEEALLANRIAYLGSVFLPMAMLMIIIEVCNIKCKKTLPFVLLGISIVVFVIAASPGYSDIYYTEVSLIKVNGVTVLEKTYGPLHSIYLYYLLSYFGSMIATIIYAWVKKKIESTVQSWFIAGTVLVNIGVWLVEQLVKIDFEFLSVSYIISEFFLLSLCLMKQVDGEQKKVEFIKTDYVGQNEKNEYHEQEKLIEGPSDEKEKLSEEPNHEQKNLSEETIIIMNKCKEFDERIPTLTRTEKKIYDMYIEGVSSTQIIEEMNITNNTLKFHNKNIYMKLNVNSRKQLLEVGGLHKSGKYKESADE